MTKNNRQLAIDTANREFESTRYLISQALYVKQTISFEESELLIEEAWKEWHDFVEHQKYLV